MYYLCMSNANVLSHGSNWPDALRLSLGVTYKITFIHSLFHIRVSGEPAWERGYESRVEYGWHAHGLFP